MGFLDDLFKTDSAKDGLKDGEKGRSDPIRESFDKDYKKGVDIGKGIRDGEKARRELDKHPIAGPIVDALGGEGLDKFGKSKDFCRTYDRVKRGESPRKVFGDEIRKSEKATREEHTRTEDYTRSYTTSDSSGSTEYSTSPYTISDATKSHHGLVKLVLSGLLVVGVIYCYVNRNNPSKIFSVINIISYEKNYPESAIETLRIGHGPLPRDIKSALLNLAGSLKSELSHFLNRYEKL
jgi:hypothetical protein